MANLTQFTVLFMPFALVFLLDLAYGGPCDGPTFDTANCEGDFLGFAFNSTSIQCYSFIYDETVSSEYIFSTRGECEGACIIGK